MIKSHHAVKFNLACVSNIKATYNHCYLIFFISAPQNVSIGLLAVYFSIILSRKLFPHGHNPKRNAYKTFMFNDIHNQTYLGGIVSTLRRFELVLSPKTMIGPSNIRKISQSPKCGKERMELEQSKYLPNPSH